MPLLSPEPSADAVMRACRASLRGGSRSFFAASFFLPRAVARRATALYAFCRLADDLIDNGKGDTAVLTALYARLDRIYAGAPDNHPADRALTLAMREFDLPRTVLDALIEGFAWDVAGRRYETLADLEAYAARVAGTVGVMMSLAMDRRDAALLARAADLGVAMQLTNIARDVGEDARAGRLYLPLAWLREEGIDPDAFLAQPAFSPALGRVIARLLREANALYRRADSGIKGLPAACRPGIIAARRLYAAIGDEVARNGFDSVARRAVVSPARKAHALLPTLAHAGVNNQRLPPLMATAFLVDAAAAPAAAAPVAWWNLHARLLNVVAIFERLAQAERAAQRTA